MYKFCPYCGGRLSFLTVDKFQCQKCSKHIFLNSRPTGTVIPVCNDKILVSVRATDPDKGKLDTVGGFLDNGEKPIDGAIREFKEETGYQLKVEQLKLITITVDKYTYQGSTFFTINPFYYVTFDEELALKPSDEVAELKWVPIDGQYDWAFKSIADAVVVLKKQLKFEVKG